MIHFCFHLFSLHHFCRDLLQIQVLFSSILFFLSNVFLALKFNFFYKCSSICLAMYCYWRHNTYCEPGIVVILFVIIIIILIVLIITILIVLNIVILIVLIITILIALSIIIRIAIVLFCRRIGQVKILPYILTKINEGFSM